MINLQLTSNTIADDIDKLINKIANPGPAQKRHVSDGIRREFQSNFTNQRSGNGAWPALAPSTVLQRQRLGFPGRRPILVRTGGLRSSYVNAGSPDHESRVFRAGGFTVYEEGSSHENALYHERGTSRMPQRSVTILGSDSENRLFQQLDYMVTQIEREVIR